MSDNFIANSGSGGSTFRAEDVGSGILATVVKVHNGYEGSAQDGWTASRLISAASTNATSVKASAGMLGFIYAVNLTATLRFLKFYNKASAPTVGSDTPIATLPIPANTAGAGFMLPLPDGGLSFSTGIAYAVTGAYADNDTTAIGLADVFLLLGYA